VPDLHLVYHCTQCGGNQFAPAKTKGHVRCAYCGSEYEVVRRKDEVGSPEPRVVVKGKVEIGGHVELSGGMRLEDGAHLTVHEGSDFRVSGDVHVDEGATLALRGDLRLVRRAPEAVIRKALKRVERGEAP